MRLWTWQFVDISDSTVPNRMKRWEFNIPYLLKSSGFIFGFDGGFSIHIRFLCFGFNLVTDVSCGKVTKFHFNKWYVTLIIRRGWSCEINIGIDKAEILSWRVDRMLRKMTPQERTKHIETIRNLLKEDSK